MPKSQTPLSEEAALRLVVEGTVSETGTAFFQQLVKNLATVMGTAGAWVTEYLPELGRLRAHAFWFRDSFVDEYEYNVAGTACAEVVNNCERIHVPERLIELYPNDLDLIPLNAVSYLGVPLLGTEGEVIGHLAVLDTKPLPAESRLISLFEIFAARAAAEQRRLTQEAEVRSREEQLNALLSGAMDAILVLDADYHVIRVNPAAEKLFGYDAKALKGARLRDLLDNESAARLPSLIQELDQNPESNRQLWIPQNLSAVRSDGDAFPTEATLSGFTLRGKNYYALILRNVNERIEAERRIRHLLDEAAFLRESAGAGELLGQSRVMKDVFTSLRRVAATDTTVLILGETGTGKELVARSIHEQSSRREKPLIRVNCAAIPGTLMESEFFGHERGAFTGATSKREGRFALADGGTIFLDEIGELPLDLQAKLLRVLQEGEFEPLGSARTQKVDVRVIAATNRDLGELSGEGRFREDLYYRLNVFPLQIPPLREREGDLALLARSFIERYAKGMGRRVEPLLPDSIKLLQAYAWPGNVRELQNVIERALILSPGSRIDLLRALPETSTPIPVAPQTAEAESEDNQILTVLEMEALERANIERALSACGGKISGPNGAAMLLGLAPSTLSSRIKALGVTRKS